MTGRSAAQWTAADCDILLDRHVPQSCPDAPPFTVVLAGIEYLVDRMTVQIEHDEAALFRCPPSEEPAHRATLAVVRNLRELALAVMRRAVVREIGRNRPTDEAFPSSGNQ
jgi:hypothetical protein